MSTTSSSSNWRNVRIKEEPVSDFEDGREGARSGRGERDSDNRRERGEGSRKDKRDRYSPPPSHSRHKSSSSRVRSRSRSGSHERERRRGDSSASRERVRDSLKDDRDRRRQGSRERQSERPENRHVKREPRSRSRSRSPPQHYARRGGGGFRGRDNRRESDRTNMDSRDARPRDGERQRDWDNFFNPNSEMSKKAVVKREKEEQNRKEALEEFGKKEESTEPKEKEQPNFGLSGKLTEESNTFRGVVIKYSEPPEARKPSKIQWRMYPFKGEEALPVMYVHRQSAYLLGRDRKVADIPVDHPSCSKQHAVLQYRLVPYTRPDGSKGRSIRPYIIDLESANGTYVNGNKVDPKRYVELFEKDVLKFGYSSREYVLLHDQSKDIQDDSPGGLTPD